MMNKGIAQIGLSRFIAIKNYEIIIIKYLIHLESSITFQVD